MIFLEKKARNVVKGNKKKVSALPLYQSPVLTADKKSNRDSIFISSPFPRRSQSPSFTLYDGSSPQTPIPISREKKDRQAKRKAYDMFKTPPPAPVNNRVQVSGSNKSIKPFHSIALNDDIDDPELLPKKRLFEPRSETPGPVAHVHVHDVDAHDEGNP